MLTLGFLELEAPSTTRGKAIKRNELKVYITTKVEPKKISLDD